VYPYVWTAPGNLQSAFQWSVEGFFLGGKAARRDADHLPPFRAKVENERNRDFTPLYAFVARCRNNSDICISVVDLILRIFFKIIKLVAVWELPGCSSISANFRFS
jgi:hypothetical protein